MFNVIIAHNSNFGIGLNGKIPWKNTQELKLFRDITHNSILIMGRKTVENLPHLQNRTIFCITSKDKLESDENNSRIFKNLEDALDTASNEYPDKKVFVAGGAQIYREALEKWVDRLNKVYISIIQDSTICDVHFDIYKYLGDWNIVINKNCPQFTNYVLQKENIEYSIIASYGIVGNIKCKNPESNSCTECYFDSMLYNG
jgi:dihydrofolate reductase